MTPSAWFDDVRRHAATVLLLSLGVNLALLAPSLFMLQVYDRVLATRSIETLAMLLLLALATLGLMGVLDHARGRTLALLGVALERRAGGELLGRTLRAGAVPGAEGLRDLARLRGFLAGPGAVALCDAPWSPVYLAVIFLFHPALGGLALVSMAVLVGLAVLSERRFAAGQESIRQRQLAVQRGVEAAVRAADAVAALGMRPAIVDRWRRASGPLHLEQLDLGDAAGRLASTGRVLRQAVQVLMLAYGAWLVVHDHVTPGVMLAATIVLGRALAPVELVIGSWKAMVEARGAWRRLRALEADAAAMPAPLPLPRPQSRLAAEALSYADPASGRALLGGVSFALEAGQVLVVVGPSGSGKTTLARLLAGALAPTAGAVRLDGADLRSWDDAARGRWIGYLPQDLVLLDGTVSDNIARMAPPEADAVLAAARAAGLHDLVLRLPQGYDTPVGDGGRSLSAGQRQRVGLARALLGDPALLVLDEPDASLDAEGEAALHEAVRAARCRGAMVVLVSQRKAAVSLADRVLVLRDGTLDRTLVPAPGQGAP